MAAVAVALASPAACWAAAAAAPLPAAASVLASLFAQMAVRGRALLTVLLATEPSSYALGMTGACLLKWQRNCVDLYVCENLTSMCQVPW